MENITTRTPAKQRKVKSKSRLQLIPEQAIAKKPRTKPVEIAMLTSYPPRECGIATFSKDLENALSKAFGDALKLVPYPLEADNDTHEYPLGIRQTLNTDLKLDFLKTANAINEKDTLDGVLIQHEFGLFRNNEDAFFEFLEFIDKPIVITFHTVLPNPDEQLRGKVRFMAASSEAVIVMTQTSATLLEQDYDIAKEKIYVIPHGTHLVCSGDKKALKKKYGFSGKKVLSTFGLLGPGKSIETTLEAMPQIVDEFPDTVFLILGKTHPTLLKERGEDYREFLKYKVEKHELEDNVRFVNEFLPLEQLLEYLQLTDIYLFTSKDPNQAVSGTFSYALSCGCPVVSTPIPHALEVLRNEAGIIFDFEDSDQLAQAVIDLLKDETICQKMSLNGLHHAMASAWENVAVTHAKIFEKIGNGNIKPTYRKPDLKLSHIKKLTTSVGIVQFAKINQPDFSSGYTLDDNARALITMCRYYELYRKEEALSYIRLYFNFISNCFRPDGTFLNYVDEHRRFTAQNNEVNLEDSNGRAIWALGHLVGMAEKLPNSLNVLVGNAVHIFEEAVGAAKDFTSPRAVAFTLKGLYHFNRNRTSRRLMELSETLGDRMVHWYEDVTSNDSNDWHWFEDKLTYGNGVLPEALLMAYHVTGIDRFRKVATESFDFLLSLIMPADHIKVITNKNWFEKGQTVQRVFEGGEQPIDVAYTILALQTFHRLFPNKGYDRKMEAAFNWFLGENALQLTIYNPCTGGCHDGLEKHNVNLNQGAESNVCYLLSRMAFEDTLLLNSTVY